MPHFPRYIVLGRYYFANNNTLMNKVVVILGISDHEVVYVYSSLRPEDIKQVQI
jgi:hypothetical protein